MEGSKAKMMNKKISIYQQQQKKSYWSQTVEQDTRMAFFIKD